MSTAAFDSPPTKDKHEAVASPTTNISSLTLGDPLANRSHRHHTVRGAHRPQSVPQAQELRIVGRHEITEIWDDQLASKVLAILDEKKVKWTSVDLVRFGYEGGPSGNVVVWIGVKPGSVLYELGIDVALQCKELLLDYGLDDVDVEIRESEV